MYIKNINTKIDKQYFLQPFEILNKERFLMAVYQIFPLTSNTKIFISYYFD